MVFREVGFWEFVFDRNENGEDIYFRVMVILFYFGIVIFDFLNIDICLILLLVNIDI